MREHIIKTVLPGSIGEELEIEPGDVLLMINNKEIEDIFDYQYATNDEYIEILIRKPDGEEWLLEVDKTYDEDIGIAFETGLMDEYRSCRNRCIFCFIDQMPKGLRETLYFKDDDSRLSFLQGNYVTLTNMEEKDVARIIKYRLEPINISVHTTNPTLRCKMLNNRYAGEALGILDRLFEGRTLMNGQVVLCKGINDGSELERTIKDLMKYMPYMQSVSVVPSGITKYRDGLFPLKTFDRQDAESVIDLIEAYQRQIYPQFGYHFIHASDEWYILAGRELPEEERYDGYIQLENGVGMLRLFRNELEEALKGIKDIESIPVHRRKRHVSIATGVMAYDTICQGVTRIQALFPMMRIDVHKIQNVFFGEAITVSGLLTGSDIINQLKGKELGDVLLLPNNVLKSGENIFLDDITLTQMKKTLQVDINIVKSSGLDFLLQLC